MAAAAVIGTPADTSGTSAGREAVSKTAELGSNPGEPAAEAKPEKEKPTPRASKAPDRETTVAKYARMMNADAEKDGVEVDAPPEERRQKPGPKPGSKRVPKPAAEAAPEPTEEADEPEGAAQANPTKAKPKAAPETAAVDADADDQDADDGKPEPRATHQLKAKARLRHGDVDKAIRLAFGDMKPEEFDSAKEALAKKLGVGSKQWADFRRFEAAERAKTKQFEANVVELSQRLQRDFQPLIDARKAYQAKDYPKAFELAFGEDINDFSRKAIHQKLSTDPEKVRLQQRLEELERKISAPPAQPQVDPAEQQRAALSRIADQTHRELTSQNEDPEIAFLGTKREFVQRVVEIRGEHYDPQTRTTIPLHVAADMARDELRRAQDEWRYDPTASGAAAPSSELPGQAGNEPVRTSHRARSPIPSQAAQAGGSTRSMTREERIKAFASRM